MVEIVSGQEPESTEFLATSMRVKFTLSGRTLARMLGKQQRVVGKTLERLSDKAAMRLLDKVEREVVKGVKPLVKDFLVDYAGYALSAEVEIDELELDWNSDSHWSAKIDPKKESIAYTVEMNVTGEFTPYEGDPWD